MPPSAREYRTVEQRLSLDPEQANQEVSQQIDEFRREGWGILSAKKLTKPDGTTHQVWKLFRDQQ